MLTSAETKLVVATLTKRRAWLRKSLDDANLDPSARQDYMDSIKIIESAIKKLAASAPPPANKPAKPTAPPAPPPRKKLTMASARVLIAEDNADSANLLLDVLQDFGMTQADLATDGMEAFDKIKRAKTPYDLILCDWDMPELTGLEVHCKAKASNKLQGAHFVMVTAVSESSRIREAIQQGVNDYIVKPIDMDVLEAKIKTALNIDDEPSTEDKKES